MLKARKVYLVKIAPANLNKFISFSSNFIPTLDEIKDIIENLHEENPLPFDLIYECHCGLDIWGVPSECNGKTIRWWKNKGEAVSRGFISIKEQNIYFK
jgi:hypothetical protein